MAEQQLKSESGVLAKASQTVDTHRAEQNAIGQRVQNAAAESQSGWQGQGAAAVAQVVQQYGEDNRRIDQALSRLSDSLKTTDQSYLSTEAESAAGAQRVGANAGGGYHNLPA
ncbi:WXG100 family type VII secretion target [Actinomyces viscosus]|uniref:Uncharacterized protein conserved in bacteria n=1 Tax=Actinomyces viscosus TaxID=1656 RepID=A0A448PMJ8_ACTVI|nr:WXG100 family type VII secretion target [Actinomyces viscosus]VEI17209.1 Uncharacterized protein conserved in bacteria [Actinomyces viscosus]